jgi:beta-mannosidase
MVAVKMRDSHTADVTVQSPVWLHRLAVTLPSAGDRASDNFFELYPDEAKTITITCARPTTAAKLRRALHWRSLVDTY